MRLALTPMSEALMRGRRETPLFMKRGTHMSIPTFLLLLASHKNAMDGIPRGRIPVDPLPQELLHGFQARDAEVPELDQQGG